MAGDQSKAFDVFLSYNGQDRDTARTLAESIRKRDLSVWFDEWELAPGRPWQESLEQIIETASVAAVLIGKDGEGPWQTREMRGCLSEFVDRNMPVIPVLLPGVSQEVKLPIFLKQYTWVDFRQGFSDEGVDRLEWGITGRKPRTMQVTDNPEPRAQYSDPELLHLMWGFLDESLQDAFALAYNKKKREGKTRIGTRDLFQSLVRIDDASVSRLIASLPKGSLPEPIDAEIEVDNSVLRETPKLSDCVAESLTFFESIKSPTRKVSTADIFVDIGKHGHGSSVRRLRQYGVTEDNLQHLVNGLGMRVMTR